MVDIEMKPPTSQASFEFRPFVQLPIDRKGDVPDPAPRYGVSRRGSVTGFGVKLYSASRRGPGANGDDDDAQNDAAIAPAELHETERPDGDGGSTAKEVVCCAFHPIHDHIIAMAVSDGTVSMVELEGRWSTSQSSFRPMIEFEHSNYSAKCLSFSPKGSWLAVGGANKNDDDEYTGKLTLYDAEHNCEVLCDIKAENTVFDCSFSASGQHLAYAGFNQPIRVLKVAEGGTVLGDPEEVFEHLIERWRGRLKRPDTVFAIPFSLCGHFLACLSGSGQLIVWNWNEKNETFQKLWGDSHITPGHEVKRSSNERVVSKTRALAFSRRPEKDKKDKKKDNCCEMLAVAYLTGKVVVRKTKTGGLMSVIDDQSKTPKYGLTFAHHPHTDFLVIATRDGIDIYDARTSTMACRFDPEKDNEEGTKPTKGTKPTCITSAASGKGIAYGTLREDKTIERKVVFRALRFDGGERSYLHNTTNAAPAGRKSVIDSPSRGVSEPPGKAAHSILSAATSPCGDRVAAVSPDKKIYHATVNSGGAFAFHSMELQSKSANFALAASSERDDDNLMAVTNGENELCLVLPNENRTQLYVVDENGKHVYDIDDLGPSNTQQGTSTRIDDLGPSNTQQGTPTTLVNRVAFSQDGKLLGVHLSSRFLHIYEMGKDGAKKKPKQVFKKKIRDKADHSSCFAFILDEKKANMIEVNMIVVPKSKKLWFYKIPDHNPLPFIKTPIDPGSSKSVAEIAVAANKHFGTLIACAFDAGLVTLINFANGKLLMKMSLHDQVLRALQPSFLVLSLPQDDAESKKPYRILYGDGDSSNVCILEQKKAAEEITDTGLEWKCQTVAVVAALGEPITATIKDDHLVIIGNEGVKSRVWEMMRQLPPPSDFAPTAVMDKDLRTKKLQQYPYLLWLADPLRGVTGAQDLLRAGNIGLLNELLPKSPAATASAPNVLSTAVELHQREVTHKLLRSLLTECDSHSRGSVLGKKVSQIGKGETTLIARLIGLHPSHMASLLLEMSLMPSGDGDAYMINLKRRKQSSWALVRVVDGLSRVVICGKNYDMPLFWKTWVLQLSKHCSANTMNKDPVDDNYDGHCHQFDDPENRCPWLWSELAYQKETDDEEDIVDMRACVTRVPHVVSVHTLEALLQARHSTLDIFKSEHIRLPVTTFWFLYVFGDFCHSEFINVIVLLYTTVFILYSTEEKEWLDELRSASGSCCGATHLLELCVFVPLWFWVVWTLYGEFRQLRALGWNHYYQDPENMFDLLGSVLVFALTVSSLTDANLAKTMVAAATQMVMFIRLFLFLRGFEATGFLGTMLFRVIGATKQYLALFVMLWVVAAEIFYVLLGFKSLSQSVEFTVRLMLGDFAGLDLQIADTYDLVVQTTGPSPSPTTRYEHEEYDDGMFNEYSSSRYQTSLYALSFVILWLSPILLLNLIITVVGEEYNEVKAIKDELMTAYRARKIFEFLKMKPDEERKKLESDSKYTHSLRAMHHYENDAQQQSGIDEQNNRDARQKEFEGNVLQMLRQMAEKQTQMEKMIDTKIDTLMKTPQTHNLLRL